MNRVIRNATVSAPQAFGNAGLEFVDASTADLIERVRAEAFEAGRREGYEAGTTEMKGTVARVDGALRDAVRGLAEQRAADTRQTIEIALEIAAFVVGELPLDQGQTLAGRIADAIAGLDDEDVVVAIHPQDWDAVSQSVRLPNGVTIQRDPSLRPGEARIAGRWATADLTREAALQVAREALL